MGLVTVMLLLPVAATGVVHVGLAHPGPGTPVALPYGTPLFIESRMSFEFQ